MSRIVFPRAVPKNFWGRAICALALVVAILVAFQDNKLLAANDVI